MTLAQIKKALQLGFHPETFPGREELGCGAFRCAWRIGDWVVKQRHRFRTGKPPVKRAAQVGVRLLIPHRVKQWDIQRYYLPLDEATYDQLPMTIRSHTLDFNSSNLARDGRGQIVAFDW